MKRSFFVLVLVPAFLALLAGCSAMPQVSTLEGAERDAAVTLVDPVADNVFAGMNEGDYTKFARDFDVNMGKALNEKAFTEMMETFDVRIGKYQSREVTKVERVDEVVVVYYSADFEKEQDVAVSVSVRESTPPQVAGLWFDSPKLREK